jgi:hypothetical protein
MGTKNQLMVQTHKERKKKIKAAKKKKKLLCGFTYKGKLSIAVYQQLAEKQTA